MSGGSCHISAIQVFSSRAEAIAHKASIVFELINSGSAVFTQILDSFFAKSLRVPSTRCGLCTGFAWRISLFCNLNRDSLAYPHGYLVKFPSCIIDSRSIHASISFSVNIGLVFIRPSSWHQSFFFLASGP
jgi:hypothetical protein